jgi:undecaprenyl-diphosphatase
VAPAVRVARAAAWVRAGRAPTPAPPPWTLWAVGPALAALAVVAGAVIGGATAAPDERLELAVHAHASGPLDLLMLGLTALGLLPVLAAAAVAAAALLLRAARRLEALALTAVMLGEGALDDALKLAVHRARPALFPHAASAGFSFPSGHAMATASLVGVLFWIAWRQLPPFVRWLGLLLAVPLLFGIGASRVYVGVHYPSDVVAGWLAGLAWLGAAPRVLRYLAALVERIEGGG